MRTETTFRRLEDDGGVIEAKRQHVEALTRLRQFEAAVKARALPLGVINFQVLEDARELERLREAADSAARAREAAEAEAARRVVARYRPELAQRMQELDRILEDARTKAREILALRAKVADLVRSPVRTWGELVPSLLIPEEPCRAGGLETWRRAMRSHGWL